MRGGVFGNEKARYYGYLPILYRDARRQGIAAAAAPDGKGRWTALNGEEKRAKAYGEKVKQLTPASHVARNCLRAFWVGGVICSLGQALNMLGAEIKLCETTSPMFTTTVLIFLGTTLTGLGVYDRIGKYAGAGSIVPVSGFANSVAAPAIEFRREGLVMGVGAKLFSIAGPVLAYGISASVLVGLFYWIAKELWL